MSLRAHQGESLAGKRLQIQKTIMQALRIYAGPKALAHIRDHGLKPDHVGVIPGAAGGPKGLILGPLDRFLFGEWLPQSQQAIDLVGASIGAWRLATACLHQPVQALQRLERDYIAQHYELPAGQKRPSASQVSAEFGRNLTAFYGGRIHEVLHHPRYRLHVLASHGLGLLQREHPWRTPLGYAGAFARNLLLRPRMGKSLERVVFSTQTELPFDARDYPTVQVSLTQQNFMAAVQASCSIPFVLQAVHDIPGAPPGAYWDGGITDYHLHLNYQGLVLYPHFQQAVVPGWLDKALKWRHQSTAFLDNTIVLAPNPAWVKTLPNGKLPDRSDFMTYATDLPGRIQAWTGAALASQQLADEFAQWLHNPRADQVLPL
jgi:hypothetical protein